MSNSNKRILFSISAIVLIVVLTMRSAYAQSTEVKEHKVEVDSSTGKVTTTTAVIEKTEKETFPYTDMLNVNPLKFLLAYNLSWVHKLGNNTAFGVGAEVTTTHGVYNSIESGWGVLGEFRFYPGKESMHGFYVAPNVSLIAMNNVPYYSVTPDALGNFNSGVYTATTLSLGLLIGWQWYPTTDFAIGFGFGVDDYIPVNPQSGSQTDFNLLGGLYGKGTSPTVRFDLGYVW